MFSDSSRLWDFAHQESAFSASLSAWWQQPCKVNTYNRKKLIHGHSPSTNHVYIQSTVLNLHFVEQLNIPSLCNIKSFRSQITNQIGSGYSSGSHVNIKKLDKKNLRN